jgi:hypothetical protein
MGANDDGAWLSTLGLIGLYRSGVSVIVSALPEVGEDPDIVSAIAVGRLDRRGKLRGFITYRVHGDHIVAMVGKFRIEFNTAHPEGISAYLLHRHIELNGKLRRQYPEYVGVPVAKDWGNWLVAVSSALSTRPHLCSPSRKPAWSA